MNNPPNQPLPPQLPPQYPNGSTGGQLPNADGAVASLVLGILSLLCAGILTGIPAIIIGHKAKGRADRSKGTLGGGGMAVAGLVMGYFSTVVTLLALVGAGVVYPKIMQDIKIKQEMREGYQVHATLTAYAHSNDGKFPDSLADLESFDDTAVDLMMAPPKGTPDAPNPFWTYKGKGMTLDSHPENTVILESASLGSAGHVEVTIGGSAKVIKD